MYSPPFSYKTDAFQSDMYLCFIKDVEKAKLSPKDNIKPRSGHKLLMQAVLYSKA